MATAPSEFQIHLWCDRLTAGGGTCGWIGTLDPTPPKDRLIAAIDGMLADHEAVCQGLADPADQDEKDLAIEVRHDERGNS